METLVTRTMANETEGAFCTTSETPSRAWSEYPETLPFTAFGATVPPPQAAQSTKAAPHVHLFIRQPRFTADDVGPSSTHGALQALELIRSNFLFASLDGVDEVVQPRVEGSFQADLARGLYHRAVQVVDLPSRTSGHEAL